MAVATGKMSIAERPRSLFKEEVYKAKVLSLSLRQLYHWLHAEAGRQQSTAHEAILLGCRAQTKAAARAKLCSLKATPLAQAL
jgi:hypothetical protein